MSEFYAAARPVLAFIMDVLLLSIAGLSTIGVVIRAMDPRGLRENRDAIDLVVLVILAAAAWNAWLR